MDILTLIQLLDINIGYYFTCNEYSIVIEVADVLPMFNASFLACWAVADPRRLCPE